MPPYAHASLKYGVTCRIRSDRMTGPSYITTNPRMMRRPDSRAILAGGAAAAMAISVYVNALHNPFVYDDYHTVIENASIRSVANLRAIFWHDVTRPLVNFSYALDRGL